MRHRCSDTDLDVVQRALLDRLEEFAIALLGEPSIRKSRKWRWGGKGGRALVIQGHKRGAWFDHETGRGGGPFHVIRYARQCSFAEAVAWARRWVGDANIGTTSPLPRRPEPTIDPERLAGIAEAQRLWASSLPLERTLGETYLAETRGIPKPAAGWPRDVARYHVAERSLIVAATTVSGEVQAIQRVRLTPTAEKVVDGRSAKLSRGPQVGAMVRLPGDPVGPLLIAEGPETGISAWAATGYETWIALGSMTKAALPTGRRVVICADDDRKHSPAAKALRKAIAAWRAIDLDVVVAYPWLVRRYNKSDFNDVIRLNGADAVRDRIAFAIEPPLQAVCRSTADEARVGLDLAIAQFFAAAVQHDPKGPAPAPVHGVRVSVGVGKSETARGHAARMLVQMRAARDQRSIVIAVPTHKLGDEQARAFEALPDAQAAALVAAVWRGREADDPDSPGQQMCCDIERVRDAQAVRASVQQAACQSKIINEAGEGIAVTCPFFAGCGYQKRRQREADIWFVAHELLFTEKPATIADVAVIIIDESSWDAGLMGADETDPLTLSLDSLLAENTIPNASLATRRLIFLRRRAFDAIGTMDGPLSRSALLAAAFTPENAKEARGLEWARKVDDGMHPGMTSAERQAAIRSAASNRTIGPLDVFWRAVEALVSEGGPEASGWASVSLEAGKTGSVRVIRLKGRKAVRKGWIAPTLIIDALLKPDLMRPYFPTLHMLAEIDVDAPHQSIRQVTDRAFSKTMLCPLEGDAAAKKPQEAKRVHDNLGQLRAILIREARQYAPGRVLIVMQRAVKEAVLAIGPMLPNAEMAHHNAVAGRDEWRDVRALIVVGRTMPPPPAVEAMAEALTGVAVEPVTGWYERVAVARETAAGSESGEADMHPNPIAEAIRWHIAEGEVLQIIGRARGVNRIESDPVDVLVLTDVPLPLPIGATISAETLKPNIVDRMIAEGGIAFAEPTEAATAYYTLWRTAEAAKKAFQRERSGTFPYYSLLIGECPPPPENIATLRCLTYQRAGAGRRLMTAWCDLALMPDPVSAIARMGGPLVRCELEPEGRPVENVVVGTLGFGPILSHIVWQSAEPEELAPVMMPASLIVTGDIGSEARPN